MQIFDCENTVQFLEVELFKLKPCEYIRSYVENIRDVYEKRAVLKKCYWDFDSFDYLLSVFVDAVDKNTKFIKKLDCFKVLKHAIKYNFSGQQLPKKINDKIFYLYQKFIFSENEEIAWCLSVMLKDQVLENNQIKWLIANCSENEHILNRVLRYPKANELIEEWANKAIESADFEGRESEICGLLIKDSMPKKLKNQSSDVLAWGIYFSKGSNKMKQDLLVEVADYSNLKSVAEICQRLNYSEVIATLLSKAQSTEKEPI